METGNCPSNVSSLTGRLSHWLQLKIQPQKPEVTSYKACCQSAEYSKIWIISCFPPTRSIFVCVIWYQEENYTKASKLLISNQKSQKQNSRKAKDIAMAASRSPQETAIVLEGWVAIFIWICRSERTLQFVDTAPLIWLVVQVRGCRFLLYILPQDQEVYFMTIWFPSQPATINAGRNWNLLM